MVPYGVLAWLNAQGESGALIVGICDSVWVLAEAALLKGRYATRHWVSPINFEGPFTPSVPV